MKKLKRIRCIEIPYEDITEKEEGVLYLEKTAGGYKAGNYLIENPEITDFEYLEKVYNRICGEPIEAVTTDRLILREIMLEDAAELYRILQTPQVRRYVDEYMMNYADFCDKLEAYRSAFDFYDCGFWGIFEKVSNKLIGRCGIQYSTIDNRVLPELGYLLDPDFTGKGYALEAAEGAVNYAFDYLGEEAVYARVDNTNEKSIKLLEKLNFQKKTILQNANTCIILYVKENN